MSFRHLSYRITAAFFSFAAVWMGFHADGQAAPKPDLWPRWEAHDPSSRALVDHSKWGLFLERYLVTGSSSGINRVRYAGVTPEDRQLLETYLAELQAVRVTSLTRAEQKAYWINLYNSLTIKVILDHYPVESITDIDISPGLFSNGPWKAKLVQVEGEKISLDDIEHRILRPIWKDNRIHYAVNCASIGCPNLQSEPFTAENTERLLEKGAREYIRHPRGARFVDDRRLVASSIYDWFQVDFGGSEAGVLRHLSRYAEPSSADRLIRFQGKIDYEYDWRLNEAK
ncbi:MAG: DUF547 domain-containing protein [Desulfobacterales bacterium]|jgi:hypothetical protein